MTPLLATAVYACILALLAAALAAKIISIRRARDILLGTGDDEELERAVRAHANLVEYAPLILVLLAIFEINGGQAWVLHAAGLCLIVGRVVHALAIIGARVRARVVGMALTFSSGLILIIGNLVVVATSVAG